jgi:hypothetical protein
MVYEKADEMAELFRKRVESAEMNSKLQFDNSFNADAAPYSREEAPAAEFNF